MQTMLNLKALQYLQNSVFCIPKIFPSAVQPAVIMYCLKEVLNHKKSWTNMFKYGVFHAHTICTGSALAFCHYFLLYNQILPGWTKGIFLLSLMFFFLYRSFTFRFVSWTSSLPSRWAVITWLHTVHTLQPATRYS